MKRWEYRTEIIAHRAGTMSATDHVHPEDLDAVINPLGAQGWEVYQIDGSIVRLKRELAEAS